MEISRWTCRLFGEVVCILMWDDRCGFRVSVCGFVLLCFFAFAFAFAFGIYCDLYAGN